MAGVLGDLQDETKFEASGIAQRGHGTGQYFVVCDKQVTSLLLLCSGAASLVCVCCSHFDRHPCCHPPRCSGHACCPTYQQWHTFNTVIQCSTRGMLVSDISAVAQFNNVIHCSTRTLVQLDERFQFKSNKSRLVKEDAQGQSPADGIDDSQFEGASLGGYIMQEWPPLHAETMPVCCAWECAMLQAAGCRASHAGSHGYRSKPFSMLALVFTGITHLRNTDTLLVVKEEAEHGGGWRTQCRALMKRYASGVL